MLAPTLIPVPRHRAQDTTFAGLPLGLVLPDYVMVPAKIREAI